jgi:transcriptional regulator with XRE-family HTH domain
MAGGVSPVVRGRRLAAALRDLRSESGKTINEVAVHLECSTAKVSRIENGLVGVRIQDARDLLDLYGVAGARREEILALVRQSRGRDWWHPYADVIPEGFDRFLGFEDEAAVISMLASALVPGLLQIDAYAREVTSARRDERPDIQEQRLALRLGRQDVLTRTDAPELNIVMDEAVLLRRVGTPALMREQHRHLLDLSDAPNIRMQILPLVRAGLHQAVGRDFVIFAFADLADPKVVYEELVEGSAIQESAEAVGRYSMAFDHARSCAMTEAESRAYLADLADRHG